MYQGFKFLTSRQMCKTAEALGNAPMVRQRGGLALGGSVYESNSCQVELQARASCHVFRAALLCFRVLSELFILDFRSSS